MNYTIFKNGHWVGDIRSLCMTQNAAKSLAVKWFGVGSSVRIVK